MFRGFYIWLTLSKIENVSYFVIKHFIYPYQDIRILIKIALRESDSNNLKIENKLSQSEKSHLYKSLSQFGKSTHIKITTDI